MKVNVDNKSQTGKTNDSARAWIVVRQLDGEGKHTKAGDEKVGLSIA